MRVRRVPEALLQLDHRILVGRPSTRVLNDQIELACILAAALHFEGCPLARQF